MAADVEEEGSRRAGDTEKEGSLEEWHGASTTWVTGKAGLGASAGESLPEDREGVEVVESIDDEGDVPNRLSEGMAGAGGCGVGDDPPSVEVSWLVIAESEDSPSRRGASSSPGSPINCTPTSGAPVAC